MTQENELKEYRPIDPYFKVETLALTNFPNILVYKAMHTDYSPRFVSEEEVTISERKAGEVIVGRLLKVGHFGPFEHPQITFNVGYFPHSVMQQARTHRISVSFDVQSFRYTGQQIVEVAEGRMEIEKLFYFRPVGHYTDRQGKRYDYTYVERCHDIVAARQAAERYAEKISKGFSEEHARSSIPFDIRQHFVVSFNARSLMHFLSVRSPMDAQLEIRELCELILPKFYAWMPETAAWFEEKLWKKNKLAP